MNCSTRKNPDSDVVIRMSKRDDEQLFFAIKDVHNRVSAVEKTYHAE
jgi:hypothetical protein